MFKAKGPVENEAVDFKRSGVRCFWGAVELHFFGKIAIAIRRMPHCIPEADPTFAESVQISLLSVKRQAEI